MFKWILDHLKIIVIVSIVIGLWITFSIIVNLYIPWDTIINLLFMLRWFVGISDWIIPVSIIFTCIGLTLILEAAEWALLWYLKSVSWFDTTNIITMPKDKTFLDNYKE